MAQPASASVTMTVRALDAPNLPPVVSINTSPQTVNGGQTINLSATAVDRDGSIRSIRWSAGAGTLTRFNNRYARLDSPWSYG